MPTKHTQEEPARQTERLASFLISARRNAYSSGVPPKRDTATGEKYYSIKIGDWEYTDRYYDQGFRSYGTETVRSDGKVVWYMQYRGGMEAGYLSDLAFAQEVFQFLKKALGAVSEETDDFFPRGLYTFLRRPLNYLCEWSGDITSFSGNEEIRFRNRVVFTHTFSGEMPFLLGRDPES